MCSIMLSCPEKVAVNLKGLRKRSGEPNEVVTEAYDGTQAARANCQSRSGQHKSGRSAYRVRFLAHLRTPCCLASLARTRFPARY